MKHIPLDKLLMYQTYIIQELGAYLSDRAYLPVPRDFVLLRDIAVRAQEVNTVAWNLEVVFRERMQE